MLKKKSWYIYCHAQFQLVFKSNMRLFNPNISASKCDYFIATPIYINEPNHMRNRVNHRNGGAILLFMDPDIFIHLINIFFFSWLLCNKIIYLVNNCMSGRERSGHTAPVLHITDMQTHNKKHNVRTKTHTYTHKNL